MIVSAGDVSPADYLYQNDDCRRSGENEMCNHRGKTAFKKAKNCADCKIYKKKIL